jgi:hypothetical protein
MRIHFSESDHSDVNGIRIEAFDNCVNHNELILFLKPLVIQIYNQFYIPPSRALARSGLPNIQRLLSSNIPTTNTLKKGEFGEILATLFSQQIKDRSVPVYKHSHKTSRNMPVHGFDCVAIIVDYNEQEPHLRFFLYEVKTTESRLPYPDFSYQIRDTFRNVSPEIFSAEIAFIWRQLSGRAVLSPEENAISELLEVAIYETCDITFCPFIVTDAVNYRETFAVPFCNEIYDKPLEPAVLRVQDLNTVYQQTMR